MGGAVKILLFLLAIPPLRAHAHGIKLIIILALAYLLQQGYRKGNKKPRALWRRSADPIGSLGDGVVTDPSEPSGFSFIATHAVLQHALHLDRYECARHAACRIGSKEASGRQLTRDESVILNVIFGNGGSGGPKSRGENAFKSAVSYGRRVGGDGALCRQRYKKCPNGDKDVDFLLSGGGGTPHLT